jgi:hypothetical protein
MFMRRLSMVPLAVLGRGDPRERAYEEAIRVINKNGGERTEELLDCLGVMAPITLDRGVVRKILDNAEVTAESLGEFYHDTVLGRVLEGIGHEKGLEAGRAAGLEAGRAEVLAELITDRFGPDPSITEIARRLARRPGGAFRAVNAAHSLDEIADIEQSA